MYLQQLMMQATIDMSTTVVREHGGYYCSYNRLSYKTDLCQLVFGKLAAQNS
jgi:hypothetical protein